MTETTSTGEVIDNTFSEFRGDLEETLKGARTALKNQIVRLSRDVGEGVAEAKAAHEFTLGQMETLYDEVRRGKMTRARFDVNMQRLCEMLETKLKAIANVILRRKTANFLMGILSIVTSVAGQAVTAGLNALAGLAGNIG